MKLVKTTVCLGLLLAVATPRVFGGQTNGPQDVQKSCAIFVQTFYDWYIAKALKDKKSSPVALALKQKGTLFSPALFRRLKADSEAQTRASGESVGLDFDPFLNSQDPSSRYVVGNITVQRESVLVDVHGVSSGKKNENPDVVAELILRDGLWLFVNFHYGDRSDRESEDLLSILEEQRENRQKQRR
jgi:hypothetical protein